MNKSPYEVLEVPETASQDEVKRAYRKKARENHPDVNPNDPDAAKRMNEINEAYDRITNPEKYARRTAGSTRSNPYSGTQGSPGGEQGYRGQGWGQAGGGDYDWVGGFGFDDIFSGAWGNANPADIHPEASAHDSAEIKQAINSINTGNHAFAVDILSTIPSTGRNARWHYLSALANSGAGNTITALEHIGKAVNMEPNNQEYLRAQRAFQQAGTYYQQESQEQGFSMSVLNPNLICCVLCALQYLMRPFCYGF